MKLLAFGCLFLIVLGLISGCQNNENTPVKRTTSTKTSVAPSAQDYNNRGTAYQRAGRLQEAVSAYQQAIKLKPTLIEAHHNLGTVYVMQGKLAEAITTYKRIIHLRPDMAEAYVNLGRAYGFAGQLDAAIAEYQKALTHDATLVYAHSMFLTLLVVMLSLPTVFVNAANIEDGLWMYLPLNEGAGQKVADHGPNNFDTELSKTAPKWVDAKHDDIKKAMEFDGKAAYVKIDMAGQKADIDSHFDDKKGITICAWVKPLKTGTDAHGQTRQPIVMKGNASMWEFALYIYDDFGAGMSVWNCPGNGVSEPSAPGTAPQGEWSHQCGTFKLKEGVKVYINGEDDPVAEAGDNGNGPCEEGVRPVFIAHREDGQWLNAVIAEVYMWDRVIDVDEMNLAMKTIGGLAVQPGGKLTTTWGNVKRR